MKTNRLILMCGVLAGSVAPIAISNTDQGLTVSPADEIDEIEGINQPEGRRR